MGVARVAGRVGRGEWELVPGSARSVEAALGARRPWQNRAVPERDPKAPPPILEYFRNDQRRDFGRVLARGATLVVIGCALVAWGILHRFTIAGSVATAAGVLVVASGPLATILGLRALLFEESYLAVRRDGLVIARTGEPTLEVPWDDVAHIVAEAGGLAIEREGQAPPIVVAMKFEGREPAALARHLEAQRRRAAHGLLR